METIKEDNTNSNTQQIFTSNEDIIAAKILKRAELARITRQLKSKLFKAGLKVRGETIGEIDDDETNDEFSSPNKENDRLLIRDINDCSDGDSVHTKSTALGLNPNTTTPLKRKSSISAYQKNDKSDVESITGSSRRRRRSFDLQEDGNNDIDDDRDHDHEVSSIINSSQRLYTDRSSDEFYHMSNDGKLQPGPQGQSPMKKINYSNLPSSPFYMGNNANSHHHHSSSSSVSSPFNSRLTSQQQQQQQSIAQPVTPPSSSRVAVLQDVSLLKTPSPDKKGTASKKDESILTTPKSKSSSTFAPNASILSTPSNNQRSNNTDIFKTPNKYVNDKEEGADLLLYLSNSPLRPSNGGSSTTNSIAQTLQSAFPTTPKKSESGALSSAATAAVEALQTTPNKTSNGRSSVDLPKTPRMNHNPNLNPSSSAASTEKFSTPKTPIMSVSKTGNGIGNNNTLNARLLNGQRTPGFSMSDYVNIFTPSPRYSRTPDVYTSLKNSLGNDGSNGSNAANLHNLNNINAGINGAGNGNGNASHGN